MYFSAVAKHLSFTVAAKELFVTQSALSHRIAELEDELNLLLFDRSKRSIQLTPAGVVLHEDAKTLIANFQAAIRKAQKVAAGTSGHLTIGGTAIGQDLLSTLIKSFRLSYPEIDLQIAYHLPFDLIKFLEFDDVDIIFCFNINLPDNPELLQKKLFRDKLCLITAHTHPLAKAKPLDLSSFSNEVFISMDPGTFPREHLLLKNICLGRGFNPKFANQAPNCLENLMLLIEAGLGVTVVSRQIATLYRSSKICCVELEGNDMVVDIFAVWKRHVTNPAVPLFLRKIGVVNHD